MLIRLDPEQVEPLLWDEHQVVAEDLFDESLGWRLSPVHCLGRLRYVAPGFLLEATLNYRQTLACTRCLEPYEEDLDTGLEFMVVSRAQANFGSGGEIELEEEDLSVVVVEEETVDTAPLVLDHVLLQVPMKPLCSEICAGLCPRCGANRNSEPDCCDQTGYDSRWSALEGLREGLERPDPEN